MWDRNLLTAARGREQQGIGDDTVEVLLGEFAGSLIPRDGFRESGDLRRCYVAGNIAPVLPILQPPVARFRPAGTMGQAQSRPFSMEPIWLNSDRSRSLDEDFTQ